MGEELTPEEPAADEAATDAEGYAPAASGEPAEAEGPGGWTAPTEADFAEAELASERARLAAQRMSWRRRTATGAILSGLALGFQQVFEDKKQDVSVILETSGEPPSDLPVEAELEGMAPRRSVVRIRPWLLGEQGEEALGDAEADLDRASGQSRQTAEGDPSGPGAADHPRSEP